MLKEARKAPAFKLPASNGETVSLSQFSGQYVVLYFYPRDNTPGCTTEALDFRSAAAKLKRRNAVVLGVSKDSIASHEKFIAKHKLNFLLLSDGDTKVMQKYGAWGEKNMYGKKVMGTIRTTVVIDPAGVVRKIYSKVKVKGHVDAVVECIDELRAAAKAAVAS